MSRPVDDIASLLNPGGPQLQLRSAVVTAADTFGWTATVLFGATSVPAAGIPCVATYLPMVGDTVQVLVASSASMLILGPKGPPRTPGWDISGGNGMALANNASVQYGQTGLGAGTQTINEQTGCRAFVSPVSVVCDTPGRYEIGFHAPYTDGGTAASWYRYARVDITRSSIVVAQLLAKEHSATATGGTVIAFGTRRLQAGDTLTPFFHHTAGVSLNVDDPSGIVAAFTGVRVA